MPLTNPMTKESPPCVWGSTRSSAGLSDTCRNHPHVYGEYRLPTSFTTSVAESPPCVWGVPKTKNFQRQSLRITPMCMGSTILSFGISFHSENHPHVYGEYYQRHYPLQCIRESPPCVWGVPFCLSGFLSIQRITPMCMGSTISGITPYSAYGNHPHVYGEYQGISSMAVAERESPPCVWGVRKADNKAPQ